MTNKNNPHGPSQEKNNGLSDGTVFQYKESPGQWQELKRHGGNPDKEVLETEKKLGNKDFKGAHQDFSPEEGLFVHDKRFIKDGKETANFTHVEFNVQPKIKSINPTTNLWEESNVDVGANSHTGNVRIQTDHKRTYYSKSNVFKDLVKKDPEKTTVIHSPEIADAVSDTVAEALKGKLTKSEAEKLHTAQKIIVDSAKDGEFDKEDTQKILKALGEAKKEAKRGL